MMLFLPFLCFVVAVYGAPSEVPITDTSLASISPFHEDPKDSTLVPITTSKDIPISTKESTIAPITSSKDVPILSESPFKEITEEPKEDAAKKILGHNVEEIKYKIPPGMFREKLYTNYWMWFLRYPQYSLDFHYHCPYEIVKEEEGDKIKPGDSKLCVCTVQLNYWIEEIREEILLDTYKIPFDDGSEELAESSVILSHPNVNVHTVALAMMDGKCKEMKYSIQDDTSVKQTVEDIDCKEVEKRKKENDDWAIENMPTREEPKDATDKDETSDSTPSSDTQVSNNAEPTDATPGEANVADTILIEGETADKTGDKTTADIPITSGDTTSPKPVSSSSDSNVVPIEKKIEVEDVKPSTDRKSSSAVIASNYTLPAGPFKEFRFANHWVPVTQHPKYSLNFYFFCPFELEPYQKLTVRQADLEECRSVIRLYMYSDEKKTDILLDRYKIRGMYINQDVIDSINIEEVVGGKTVVLLRMVNDKCRRKTYEIVSDKVKAHKEEVECPSLPEKPEPAKEDDKKKDKEQ